MSLFPELRSAFALLEHPTLRSNLRAYPNFGSSQTSLTHQPALDVHEEKGEDGQVKYVVEADLPGAKKEDVNVEFSDAGRTLIVSGKVFRSSSHTSPTTDATDATEATTSSPEANTSSAGDTAVTSAATATNDVALKTDGTTWHAWERSYGSFSRSVRFPVPVDVESAKASYEDGVLKVTVGTKAEEQRRKVEIL